MSGDLRVPPVSDDPRAHAAIVVLTDRIASEAGALIRALGGLDGLVFTACFGEHAPAVRSAVCERLARLGLRFDDAVNAVGNDRISIADAAIEVRIIATGEEAMIAHYTLALIRQRSRTSAGFPATLLEPPAYGTRDEIEPVRREIETPL